ncbi:hypothetical protein [Mucilaginibacter conchicola]|nr:hypothetical protein [Mucilaginibacter conchicola]
MLNAQPKHNITAALAIDLINNGTTIVDTYIEGHVEITSEDFTKEITFINCIIESFTAVGIDFAEHIKFENSHLKSCQFNFAYFSKGLTIKDCLFDNRLSFAFGGHNQPGYTVSITKNHFHDYVDFFDCWFTSEIVVTNNIFSRGTNIESKNQLITFDIQPIISNNIGQLDLPEDNQFT